MSISITFGNYNVDVIRNCCVQAKCCRTLARTGATEVGVFFSSCQECGTGKW